MVFVGPGRRHGVILLWCRGARRREGATAALHFWTLEHKLWITLLKPGTVARGSCVGECQGTRPRQLKVAVLKHSGVSESIRGLRSGVLTHAGGRSVGRSVNYSMGHTVLRVGGEEVGGQDRQELLELP